MDLFVEWRVEATRDGYLEDFDGKQALDHESRRALKLRAQMFTFAARLIDSQHRLFLFAVDIYGDRARLYRFDPSCVVVSEPILFRKDSRPLDEFFMRYTAASPAERGYDPTIVPATDLEKALFRARVIEYRERVEKNNLRSHPDVNALTDDVVRVQVNDSQGGVNWYLACRCGKASSDRSPCGRFTRGFIATPASLDDPPEQTHPTVSPSAVKKGRLFWLKDSWRPADDDSELSVYNQLKAKGVPNLPEIICAGDILCDAASQDSLNSTVLSDLHDHTWARPTKPIHHMIHHRIVSVLLIPLTSVRNARELLLVGRDILTSKLLQSSY